MKTVPLLALEHISMKFFNQDEVIEVLDDITFELQQGEIAALLGPSGCGKSTILNILSGLLQPTGGKITRNGSVGYMFQRDHLLDWRTIYDNVCIGLEIQHQQKSEEHLQVVERLLRTYDLWTFRKRYPAELSGGMRQRAALIRTLAINPDILLLDEPFSALDSQTRLMVSEDIATIIQKEQKTTLLVTHDISEAISFADTIYTLSHRPSKIKTTYHVQLTTEEPRTPLKARKAPEFQNQFNTIWEEMMQYERNTGI